MRGGVATLGVEYQLFNITIIIRQSQLSGFASHVWPQALQAQLQQVAGGGSYLGVPGLLAWVWDGRVASPARIGAIQSHLLEVPRGGAISGVAGAALVTN